MSPGGPSGRAMRPSRRASPSSTRPTGGGHGLAAASLSVNFISAAAAAGDYRQRLQSRRRAIPVTGTRRVSKRHMLYNQANPHIAIDPHTADIRINGEALPPVPTADVPLNRRYFLL